MQNLEPARPRRLADDDLRHVVGLRVTHDVIDDVPIAGGKGNRFAAERFRQSQGIGNAIALHLRELCAAPPLDIKRHPWAMQAVGQSLGVADETGRARVVADANKDALACRPRALDGAGLHLGEQLLVHALGGATQSEFAERGKICRRKEILKRAFGLLGNVDFAFLQALNQIVRCEVDQLDGVGTIEDGVRHRLAHTHTRDLCDHVIETFDVLDVDRGIDVDAVAHQLFDIEIALGVAAAFDVGVRKFIDRARSAAAGR